MSGAAVPPTATTTIVATLCLQIAAVTTSLAFGAVLYASGGHDFRLPAAAMLWAALAGMAIGAAEIGYFYLFGGVGEIRPIAANVAIPIVVSGTIVITMLVSWLVFGEPIGWRQILGAGCILVGTIVLFSDRF
jgi:drug/metabolite transporter (DMT)-like permease